MKGELVLILVFLSSVTNSAGNQAHLTFSEMTYTVLEHAGVCTWHFEFIDFSGKGCGRCVLLKRYFCIPTQTKNFELILYSISIVVCYLCEFPQDYSLFL